MIDLASLNALRAVDVHGSVAAAAASLDFTPSAVSQQIKRLERQTASPLLERVGRGVILTAQGRQLVEAGARLLGEMEELEARMHRDADTVAGGIRLTAFSTATRGLIPAAASSILRAHPGLALSITEREPWDAITHVASGRTDIAVVHSWGDVPLDIPAGLVATPLMLDVADVIVPDSHRLAAAGAVSVHELVGETWIATPEGTICRQWLRRMHDGTGTLPHVAHESGEFESQIALVRAGLGIALIPRLGRSVLPVGLTAIATIRPASNRRITALHRQTMDASPAVQAVLGELRRVGAALG